MNRPPASAGSASIKRVGPRPESRRDGQVQRNAGDADTLLRADDDQGAGPAVRVLKPPQDQDRLVRRQTFGQGTPTRNDGTIVMIGQRHGG